MSEMIERVAKALADKIGPQYCYSDACTCNGPEGVECKIGVSVEEIARAAIEAMREPTEAQYNALCATDKLWRQLTSSEVWRVYIDAALADSIQPVT